MIHINKSFKDYAAEIAVNQSLLKVFNQCPAKYLYALQNPVGDNPAFAKGRLWHTAVLEPTKLDAEYQVLCEQTKDRLLYEARAMGSKATEFSKRLKTYQLWRESLPDADIITEEELSAAMNARSLLYNGKFKDAIDSGIAEASFFNEYDAEAGTLKVKGRFDLWCEDTGEIWDLKTTRDASPHGFGKLAWSYGYVFQAGFYRLLCELEGKQFNGFNIVAVETEPPNLFGIYSVDSQASRWGAEMARAALERLAYCTENDDWPGYGSGYLELPTYALKEISEDLQTLPDLPDPF